MPFVVFFFQQSRQMSFFGNAMDNLKNSLNRDKELKEKLAQLEREAKKLEENEALKRAKEASESGKVRRRSSVSLSLSWID